MQGRQAGQAGQASKQYQAQSLGRGKGQASKQYQAQSLGRGKGMPCRVGSRAIFL